jgi:glutathione S-transferase
MRLYYHPFSSSARRATLAATYMKVPVELSVVNLGDAEGRQQLEKLNPNSKIPVLQDGDLVLWESCAIMQYMAEKTPGQTAYPSEAKARADVNRWMFWAVQHFSPAIGILGWERMMKAMFGRGEPDPVEIAKGEAQFKQFAAVLDNHLNGRQWVSGAGVTLADFALAAPLMHAAGAQLPLASYPHISAWFDRVQGLDAWKKTAPNSFT